MTDVDSRTLTRTDWLLLGVLLACILPLRVWLLNNTEVTARDSIGYIRYALQFERMDWHTVWKDNAQHPGYPVAIWLTAQATGAINAPTPDNMRLSAQLVSFIASLILGVLMYLLGRQFFDAAVSFGAALLYQYLPVSAHHLSDGISEPLYLVLLVSGLLHMVLALRDRSIVHGMLCGTFSGLAYLTRPEGLFIVPAFGVMLVAAQVRPAWRGPWLRTLWCGLAMFLAALLVAAIYVYATGRITNKISAIETLKNLYTWLMSLWHANPVQAGAPRQLFAASFPPIDSRAMRLWQSVCALCMEIMQGFHYAASALALLGFVWSFKNLRGQASFWALVVFSVLHSLILIALAMSVCYVSDRHVMILVLGGCYFVVIGLRELPRRVLSWFVAHGVSGGAQLPWYRSAAVWTVMLFAILLASCLPKATARLHDNRVANREAGLWLAQNLDHARGDHIEDDHAWSLYYSGFLFKEGEVPVLPAGFQPTTYVVVTRSSDPQIDAKRHADAVLPTAQVVGHWPTDAAIEKARVVVYAQPRDWDRNRWTKR